MIVLLGMDVTRIRRMGIKKKKTRSGLAIKIEREVGGMKQWTENQPYRIPINGHKRKDHLY